MEFCEEVEYLINLLKNPSTESDLEETLSRLEKILEEHRIKRQYRN